MKPTTTTRHLSGRQLSGYFALLCAMLATACAPSDFDEVVGHEKDRDGAAECDPEQEDDFDAAGCAEPQDDAGTEQGMQPSTGPIGGADDDDDVVGEVPREAGTIGPTDDGGREPAFDAEVPDGKVPARDAGRTDAGVCADCVPDTGPVGPCSGRPRTCEPDDVASEMQACGDCGSGVQARMRTCAADGCGWGAWSAWSACADAVTECAPNDTDMQMEACGACNTGTRMRTRSCSASSCTWDGWSAWSACTGVTAACSPGQTMDCSPADSCGQRVCSASCTWGGCEPRAGASCLRRRNGTQEEGSNYHCCGGGRWQFCLPSCQWSSDCAACSPSNCEC